MNVTETLLQPETDWLLGNTSIANTTTTVLPSAGGTKLLYSLYFWLFGVFLFMLSFVGIVTNAINIYVLGITVRKNHRPMYHFLICMAIMDLLVSL